MSPHSGVLFKVQVAYRERRKISLCGPHSVKAFKPALYKADSTALFQIKSDLFQIQEKATNTFCMCEIRLPLCPTQHFGFSSFLFPFAHLLSHIPLSEAMFSLLFHHVLGELGQMKPYKHTHASTRAYFDSWTH